MYAFEYHRAGLASPMRSRCSAASDGKLLAGGQTLHPDPEAAPGAAFGDVIDLAGIGELTGIKRGRPVASPSAP